MRNVLMVDDERQIVKLIEINLHKAGHNVICAYDGRQGLDKARTNRPDLIVLDWGLPDMSGSQVLTGLRGDPATRHIPVVTLGGPASGAGLPPSRPKPLNPRELMDIVDRAALGWAVGVSHMEARERSRAGIDMASDLVLAPTAWPADEIVAALRRAGCSVARATFLETALARVRRQRPERVLIVGYEAQEADDIRSRLRREPILSHTPVLVLTDADAVRRFTEILGR